MELRAKKVCFAKRECVANEYQITSICEYIINGRLKEVIRSQSINPLLPCHQTPAIPSSPCLSPLSGHARVLRDEVSIRSSPGLPPPLPPTALSFDSQALGLGWGVSQILLLLLLLLARKRRHKSSRRREEKLREGGREESGCTGTCNPRTGFTFFLKKDHYAPISHVAMLRTILL